jgi:hypothetical protein
MGEPPDIAIGDTQITKQRKCRDSTTSTRVLATNYVLLADAVSTNFDPDGEM